MSVDWRESALTDSASAADSSAIGQQEKAGLQEGDRVGWSA